MKFSESMTIDQVIEEICKSSKFNRHQSFNLFRPSSNLWLRNRSATLGSFDFEAKETILFVSRYHALTLTLPPSNRKQLLLVDFSRPIKQILPYLLRKFDISDDSDHFLLHLKEKDLDLDPQTSLIDQNVDPNYSSLSIRDRRASPVAVLTPQSSFSGSSPVNLTAGIAQLQGIVKQGPLTKANRKKKWERRWFVLSQDHLFYYRSQADPHPAGVIPVASFQLRSQVDLKKRLYQFELVSAEAVPTAKHNCYPIRANDEPSLKEWMGILQPITGRSLLKAGEDEGASAKKVFGGKLEDACDAGKMVPFVVLDAIQYLQARALEVEGIFRLSGSAPRIQQYIAQYNQGERVNFGAEPDPHTVSGVMKQFFRDMEEPILTYELYTDFMAADAAGKWDLHLKLGYLRHLIASLPARNRDTLIYLFDFLLVVAKHSSVNQMAFHNLATVFGPNLLKPRGTNMLALVSGTTFINSITHALLENYETIFKNGPMPPLPSPSDPDREPTPGAVASFDFPGTNPQELPLKTGDLVHVFHKDTDGWWRGESNGRFGRFPGQYVKLLSAVALARALKKQAYERKMNQLAEREKEELSKVSRLEEELAAETAQLAQLEAFSQKILSESTANQLKIADGIKPYNLKQFASQLLSVMASSAQDTTTAAQLEENLLTEVGTLHKALVSITTPAADPKKAKKDKKADISHIELVRDSLFHAQTKVQSLQTSRRSLVEHRKILHTDLNALGNILDLLIPPSADPPNLTLSLDLARQSASSLPPTSPRPMVPTSSSSLISSTPTKSTHTRSKSGKKEKKEKKEKKSKSKESSKKKK